MLGRGSLLRPCPGVPGSQVELADLDLMSESLLPASNQSPASPGPFPRPSTCSARFKAIAIVVVVMSLAAGITLAETLPPGVGGGVGIVGSAGGGGGIRLRVDAATGNLYDPSSGSDTPIRLRGINWGRRKLPSLYNASDPHRTQELFGKGANHVRLVLDWYSAGACYTDSFSADTTATGTYLSQEWLDYIDDAVNWTTKAGMWMTITMRNNGKSVGLRGL